MGKILEDFAAECREALKRDPGPGGLEQVRQGLERVLVNEAFLAEHLGPDADKPREVIYEDPELGFCVCAHVQPGASESPPHDHGASWAIYGQAKGTTEMTEWRKVRPPENGEPGKVEAVKTYELRPGMAVAYGVGQLHSPKRANATRLIRIEGANLTDVPRDRYEVA